jgi:predicted dienelactone hydrolase
MKKADSESLGSVVRSASNMSSFTGYRSVELRGEPRNAAFPMMIMYPTPVRERAEEANTYSSRVLKSPALEKNTCPLAVISHGSGGTPLLYRTLARHLANNGFIVGIPEHPFNNRNDNSLAGTVENLVNRPKHIRSAVDWFFESKAFSPFLKPNAVAVIGHSMGGYTALALAGGVPTPLPREAGGERVSHIDVNPDPRVKTLVLLAPAAAWFRDRGALSKVAVPILMLVGEKDKHTPYERHARLVLDGVPDKTKIQCKIVENAGHFSFLSPFPQHMIKESFPPSQDPPGFDRVRFHHAMNAEILNFLSRTLQ